MKLRWSGNCHYIIQIFKILIEKPESSSNGIIIAGWTYFGIPLTWFLKILFYFFLFDVLINNLTFMLWFFFLITIEFDFKLLWRYQVKKIIQYNNENPQSFVIFIINFNVHIIIVSITNQCWYQIIELSYYYCFSFNILPVIRSIGPIHGFYWFLRNLTTFLLYQALGPLFNLLTNHLLLPLCRMNIEIGNR